ncbi:MAG: hypothetical protein ACI4F4_07335 [Lachnospiraceae bacterium]
MQNATKEQILENTPDVMNDHHLKRKKITLCIGIVMSYLVMYGITLVRNYAVFQLNDMFSNYMLYTYVNAIIGVLIVILIPLENINYIWHADFVYKYTGIKQSNPKRNQLFAMIVMFAILCVICLFMNHRFIYWFEDFYFCHILTMFVLLMLVFSPQFFQKNTSLVIFNISVITINSWIIYCCLHEFYMAFFAAVGLNLAWCVFLMKSNRDNKSISIISCIVINLILFKLFVDITHRHNKIAAWFCREENDLTFEHLLLKNHSFQISKDISMGFSARHPFCATYSYLGIVPLLIFILAFLVMGVMVILSRKYISEKRHNLMLGFYICFAIVFVYSFFADLGFVPTASVPVIYFNIQIIAIAVVIRLFISRKIPQQVIDDCIYMEKPERIDEFYLLKRIQELDDKQYEMYRYLAYQELKNASKPVNFETDFPDLSPEEVEKIKKWYEDCPKRIVELMEAMRRIENEEEQEENS